MITGKTDSLTEKYGDTFGIYLGWSPMIFVSDVTIMREINIKQFSNFPVRQANDDSITVMGKFAKDFISIIDGSQWRRVRKGFLQVISNSTRSNYITF